MRRLPLLVPGLLVILAACGDAPTDPAAAGPIQLSVVAATTEFVQCGQEIPIIATATDYKGKPVKNLLVNFNVLEGGGSVFGGSAITNDEGVARDYWTIGNRADVPNTLAVRKVDPNSGAKNTYFTQTVTTLSKIVFTSGVDGHSQIFVMNADGSGVERLTSSTHWEESYFDPEWSPDGSKIALRLTSKYQGQDHHLFIMNADGSGFRNLTVDFGQFNAEPAWSPDGRKIAFQSRRGGESGSSIYVIDVDGTNETRLTQLEPDSNLRDEAPTWSPDGSRIVFTRAGASTRDLYIMNSDGTNMKQLTSGVTATNADWSPDGRKIVLRISGTSKAGIYTINADGSGMQQVPNTGFSSNDLYGGLLPTWSPSGKIAFLSYDSQFLTHIYSINPDGSDRTRLGDGDVIVSSLGSWSGCIAP